MDDWNQAMETLRRYEADHGAFATYPAYLLEMFFSTHLTDVDGFKIACFALKNQIQVETIINVLQVTLVVRPSEQTLNRLRETYINKRDSGYSYWSYDLKNKRLEWYDGGELDMLPGAKLRQINEAYSVHDRLSIFGINCGHIQSQPMMMTPGKSNLILEELIRVWNQKQVCAA